MSQADVIDFLKKEYKKDSNKWFSSSEIIDNLKDLSSISSSTMTSLKKLRNQGKWSGMLWKMDYVDWLDREVYLYRWRAR